MKKGNRLYLSVLFVCMMLLVSCGKAVDNGTPSPSSEIGTDTKTEEGEIPLFNSENNIFSESVTVTRLEGEEIDNSIFAPEIFSDRMFWGDWVRLDSSEGDDGSGADEKVKIKIGDYFYNTSKFPAGFYLGTERYDEETSKTFDFGTFGKIGFNADLDVKKMTSAEVSEFNIKLLGGDVKLDEPVGSYSFDCLYHVKDDVIAFGIMEDCSDTSVGDRLSLIEMDNK